MNLNPAQSQRLSTFRDYNDIEKVVKSKILNKKTWVPNLDASRKTKPAEIKNKPLESDNSTTKINKQYEKKRILETEGIFSSNIEKANSNTTRYPNKNNNDSESSSIIKKRNKLKCVVEELNSQKKSNDDSSSLKYTCKYRGKFDKLTTSSVYDLPVSIPRLHSNIFLSNIKTENESKMIRTLTNILKLSHKESPIFILKSPKYIPKIADDIEDSKINLKQNCKENRYKCTIHDIPEGQIGKLQILKSGKMRLVLGKCNFSLHCGVKVHFREEIAVIQIDSDNRTGEIIHLANIEDHVIAVPDSTELIPVS